MIKARTTTGLGLDMAILGLSANNVDQLRKNRPIKLNLSELGLPAIEVAIIYGDTEEDLVEDFRALGVKMEKFRDER